MSIGGYLCFEGSSRFLLLRLPIRFDRVRRDSLVKMLNLVIFLLVIGCVSLDAATVYERSRSLRMAMVLFRHGDRSPIKAYPSDPHKDYPWVNGYLALQPRGVEQMYELGQYLRERYGILVPSHGMYTSDTTYVLSSASERCILTAQSLLASFYKPPENAINITIPWQPVTVHVIKPDEDILLGQRRKCPKLEAVREEIERNPPSEFKKWVHSSIDLKDFVSLQIGAEVPNFRQLMEVADALEVYHNHGLELPRWADKIFPNKTTEFISGFFLTFSATDELKRIRGGAILNELLDKMKAKRSGSLKPNRTLLFYSAHDVTQTNLFNTMGIKSLLKSRPGYGSTTVFELHETLPDDMEVRMVYYPNTKTRIPIEVEIPNCDKPCSLTNFDQSVSDMLLDNYDLACSLENPKDAS